jgi:hypothetical protein
MVLRVAGSRSDRQRASGFLAFLWPLMKIVPLLLLR